MSGKIKIVNVCFYLYVYSFTDCQSVTGHSALLAGCRGRKSFSDRLGSIQTEMTYSEGCDITSDSDNDLPEFNI